MSTRKRSSSFCSLPYSVSLSLYPIEISQSRKKEMGSPFSASFLSLLFSIFWWRTGGSVGFRCYIIQHTEWYCRAAQRDDVSTRPFALRRVSRPTFLISSSSFQAFIASPSHVVVATRQLNGNTPTASSWFSFSFHVDPNSCVML